MADYRRALQRRYGRQLVEELPVAPPGPGTQRGSRGRRLRPLRKRHRTPSYGAAGLALVALMVLSGLVGAGYLVETEVIAPLGGFFHRLSGEQEASISGRAWNLLLLGSDNDGKFLFPAVLTQVMMV